MTYDNRKTAVLTHRKSISGSNIRFWDEEKDAKTAAHNLTNLMGGNAWAAVQAGDFSWLIRSVAGAYYDADGKIPQHLWGSLSTICSKFLRG